jgi:acetylglutamate kinase
MTGKIISIIKVGGAIVEDETRLMAFLRRFSLMPEPKILVHGGGREATKIAALLGVETKMIGGRRITSDEMLRVVTMVYGGLVNKNIVAALQSMNINAIGLSGADADIMVSHRRPVTGGIDYGCVGDVDRVDAGILMKLLQEGMTPVIAPLTHDGKGNLLNTNADTIAGETAKALAQSGAAVELTFCFEKPGVLADADDDSSVIAEINRDSFNRLTAEGVISGGMIPKISNALDSIDSGVKQVFITSADALGGDGGTVIR